MAEIYRRNYYNKREYQIEDIEQNKSVISPVLFFVLTLMYTVAYNSSWRAITLLWYGVSLMAIALLLIVFIKNDRFRLDFYTGWVITFFVYALISSLWSINVDPVLEQLKTLILIFGVNVLLVQIIDTKQDVEKLLKSNFIALFILLVYIVVKTDVAMLGDFRIGTDTLGKYWNANDIGRKLSIGVVLSLYFMLKTKGIKRVFYFVLSLVFLFIILMTGSRTALVIVVFSVGLMFWLKAKKYRMLVFLALLGLAVIGFILIMKIPILYNIIGVRFETLIKEFMGQSANEGSFDTRQEMINLGVKWFEERPILGYGLNNFRELYFIETGINTYSHSNFVEILVGGGLVGFAIYYAIFVYMFMKLFKYAFFKRDIIAIILFVFNLSLVIMHVSNISYYSTADNCLLMLAIVYISIRNKSY